MNPAKRPDDLEQRLRSAAAFAPLPPAGLRGRILDAVRAAPEAPPTAADPFPAMGERQRWGGALAAAAAALALASAWWLARVTPESTPDARELVALSQDLLGAGSRVLTLPARAEAGLRMEAEKLLADTTRIAEDVVRGLPIALRPQRSGM